MIGQDSRDDPSGETRLEGAAAEEFDEAAYMVAFPKIAEAIRSGTFKSAFDHYTRRGASEGRLQQARYQKALVAQRMIRKLAQQSPPVPQPGGAPLPTAGIDTVLMAPDDTCLVIGWIDDRARKLTAISLRLSDGSCFTSTNFARCRRADAEAVTGCPPGILLGFWTLIAVPFAASGGAGSTIELLSEDVSVSHAVRPAAMQLAALRDMAFEYFASTKYFGAAPIETFLQLENGIGEDLLQLNQAVSSRIAAGAYVERHGPARQTYRASIIVCLYGKVEFFFIQAAFFSMAAGADEFEYIYVSNSPELAESLQREARIASRLYGLSVTLVILPGNAGFGAANNAAVGVARSERLIILNPDVFPRDAAWPARHAAIIGNLPAAQTKLFGVPLFYDDGSLMHGGMFFDIDTALSVQPAGIITQELLRVEHYGKGAPPNMPLYRQSRRVPAVTGAFIGADRSWFEKLGGFTEDYVFGHYEDADLCLKSWQAGQAVWYHDLPFWHLEGKGSSRRPAHEGGSTLNRWHFTRNWLPIVQASFNGPHPAGIEA
jgi:GT2 family glycosyltransferase